MTHRSQHDLLRLLDKLDLKSAEGRSRYIWLEPLDSVLKNVTFDMKNLILWPIIGRDD